MDLSFVSGWMVSIPIVIVAALLVWALIQPEQEWVVEMIIDPDPYDWEREGL